MKIGLTFDDALSKHAGIGRYILDLYNALKEVEGVEPIRVFLRSSGGKRKAIVAPKSRKSFLNKILKSKGNIFFKDLREKGHLDIIHDTGNYHLPLRRGGLIGVESVHDIGPKLYPDFYPKGEIKYYAERLPKVLESAEGIIAASKATKAELLKNYKIDSDKIHVVYYGLDPLIVEIMEGTWKFETGEISSAKAKNGVVGKYILSVGTLNPRKNIERLIKAFDKVARVKDDISLIVVGMREWKTSGIMDTWRHSEHKGRIKLVGYLNYHELAAIYTGADAFICPSLCEGFGLSLIEAMACDTPVATSNISSLKEVVGTAGIQFDPLNVDQMTEAIHKVLEPKTASTLRTKGKKRASMFRWEKSAQNTAKVYRKLTK